MNKQMHISNGNKRILQIAVPSIISNITVPLLGLVDVTIVGHLGSAAYIGAIAVGGMLFNIIYWIFTIFCVIAIYIGKREFCIPMNQQAKP